MGMAFSQPQLFIMNEGWNEAWEMATRLFDDLWLTRSDEEAGCVHGGIVWNRVFSISGFKHESVSWEVNGPCKAHTDTEDVRL